jgi:hypothetical protein
MSKFNRQSLLKFLSKPRFVYEVEEYYKISKKLAYTHLREAIKSGQVLISEKPVMQTLQNSSGKQKTVYGFAYIFRKSPLLVNGWAKFTVKEQNNSTSKSKGNAFSIRFLPKAHNILEKAISHKLSEFTFKETVGSSTISQFLKKKESLSKFGAPSTKIKPVKYRTVDSLLRYKTRSTQGEVKTISHAEEVLFFQAMLKEPLPFLELHSRFSVSKQTIRRLVKNELLTEMWGSKGIGLRFKLTDKGKSYLKELEAAAKCEPKIGKKAFIRLKHFSF